MLDDEARGHSTNDPDPVAVIMVVISAVTMFAQLATLKLQAGGRSPPSSVQQARDKLKDAVEDASRSAERLFRVIAHAKGDTGSPIESKFRFGESRMYLSREEFSALTDATRRLSGSVTKITIFVHNFIQIDPSFAAKIGAEINAEFGNIQDLINGLLSQERTNGSILEDCLMLIRAFDKILDRLERSSN